MKAKAIKLFYDRKGECYRKKDDEFEVDPDRLKVLISAGVAEEVKEEKPERPTKKG